MSTFDPTKPVRTRAGLEARILCTDAPARAGLVGYPIIALVFHPGAGCSVENYTSDCSVENYTSDGRFHKESIRGERDSGWDLVNVPPGMWVCVWGRSDGSRWHASHALPTEEAAIAYGREIINRQTDTRLLGVVDLTAALEAQK